MERTTMTQKNMFQLCDHTGEEWAMIITEAPQSIVQKVWSKVIEEDHTGTDEDPLDKFMETLGYTCERMYISAYIKP